MYGGTKFDNMDILKRGSRILTAQIKSSPRPLILRDFFLFIPTSLAKLCVDFKVQKVIFVMASTIMKKERLMWLNYVHSHLNQESRHHDEYY